MGSGRAALAIEYSFRWRLTNKRWQYLRHLAPVGVYLARASRPCRWALTPPLHPCLCLGSFDFRAIGGHHFCGTILTVARTGRYPATCSVVPGLSSGVTRTPAIVSPSLFTRHHSPIRFFCTDFPLNGFQIPPAQSAHSKGRPTKCLFNYLLNQFTTLTIEVSCAIVAPCSHQSGSFRC